MKKLMIVFILCHYAQLLISQRSIETGPVFGAAPNYVQVTYPLCNDATNELELAWTDDFNGSSLDLTKWKVGWAWGLTYGTTCWADANQISFTGNSIKFAVNNNPAYVQGENNQLVYRQYAAGAISTPEIYGYGYYEIRCRIPLISKHHPAFWLFGGCAQEIDVFEFVGMENIPSENIPGHDRLSLCNPHRNSWYIPIESAAAQPIMTYHSPQTGCNQHHSLGQRRALGRTLKYNEWNVNPTPFDPSHGCQYSQTVDVDFHNDWHTFGMKNAPEGITWYIDGVAKLTEYRYYTAQMIYDPSMQEYTPGNYQPITDLATFCSNNSTSAIYEQINLPGDNIKMSVILENFRDPDSWFNGYNLFDYVNNNYNWADGFLEVDYFKCYRFTECNKNLEFCNNTQLSNYQNNVKAKNITFKNNCTINTTSQLNLKALEEIKILSEFASISNFSAEIKNCIDGDVQRMNAYENSDPENKTTPPTRDRAYTKNTGAADGEYFTDHNFYVYPNPSTGDFIVRTANELEKQIKVINSLGLVVYQKKFDSENYNLNLNLTSGVYIVEITSKGFNTQQKIVIEN